MKRSSPELFHFTGNYKTKKLTTGNYKFELWGASGGNEEIVNGGYTSASVLVYKTTTFFFICWR